jgi:hypothetical protein
MCERKKERKERKEERKKEERRTENTFNAIGEFISLKKFLLLSTPLRRGNLVYVGGRRNRFVQQNYFIEKVRRFPCRTHGEKA